MESNFETIQVLHLMQALIGAVSWNFRRVTLELTSDGGVRLRFLLERECAEDRDEIDDVVFEFEALQSARNEVDVEVLVDDRPIQDIVLPGRVIYGRRE